MRHGATFSSTLRFSTIASGATRPWAISARPSSRSLLWRRELTTVSVRAGEDHGDFLAAGRNDAVVTLPPHAEAQAACRSRGLPTHRNPGAPDPHPAAHRR